MRSPIRRAYVDVPHGQLHYRRTGQAGAPLLVLLHQTPSTSEMYAALMLTLADRFDLLALDTPGFGNSDPLPQRFTVEGAATALSAAVSQLQNGACNWFGHHTGAALALQVAHDRPEQVARLAMSGPCLLSEQQRERLPKIAASLPLEADGEHLKQIWKRITAKDPDAPPELLQREVLSGAAAGDGYAQAYEAVVAVDTAAQLRALKCPTLVFAGTEDPLYPQLDNAFQLLDNGQKAEIQGARTFVCERNTVEVARILSGFFGTAHG